MPQYMFMGTLFPSLSPDPSFGYHFKACRKGDATGEAATVGQSAMRVLADASETNLLQKFATGAPGCEVHTPDAQAGFALTPSIVRSSNLACSCS
jgi:hypothetical protein